MEEWCSYFCLWKFSHEETLQQTSFNRSWILLAKTAKSRFVPPFGDLGVTYTVHLWLVGKGVVDLLLVLIELFSPALTVEALWADIGRNRCVRRGSHFERKFQGMGRHSPTTVGVRKLVSLGYHMALVAWSYVLPLVQYWRVADGRTRTDGRTGGHTMTANIRASIASRW